MQLLDMKINSKFICIILIFCFIIIKSQSVEGKVMGIDKKLKQSLVISIFNKKLHFQTNIDSNGDYYFSKVDKGEYDLHISINKKVIYNQQITVLNDSVIQNIDLNEKIHLIDEVIVEKNSKIIQTKLDKLIYNVNESIYSNGFDASEVLSKVPMIKVDDQGINILNRGKVLVLINNRRTFLEGNDLITYLKNIPSSTISKIELNTNPPANYDAEGSLGVINIILKKNYNNMFNIGYSSSFTKKRGEAFLNGLNLTYSKKSLQIISRFNYNNQRQINTSYSLITQNNIPYNESDLKQNIETLGKGFYTSINYAISKRIDAGIDIDLRKSNIENNIENNLKNESILFNHKEIFNSTINLFTSYKLDSLGKKLEFSSTYFFNKNNFIQDNTSFVTDKNKFNYRIASSQFDITLPLKKNLEILTGLKTTIIRNEQTFFFNQDYINTNFKESIYAGYFSASKKMFDKLNVRAGIRYENYNNEFLNILTKKKHHTHNNDFFPSIYIDYEIKNNNKISFSYSRRINRPNFRYLDPFKTYYTEKYYQIGNPNLKPFYTNNLELKYINKGLNFMLFRTQNKNMFANTTRIENDYQVQSFENFFDLTTTGVNIRYSFELLKNFESSIMTNISYSNVQMLNESFTPKKGIILYYYIDNNLFLNKSRTLFLNFSYLHSLPTNSINSYLGNVANFSGGLKLLLMQKQMQLNLSFNDVFMQQRDKGTYYYNGYSNSVYDYRDVRSITLGFFYSIGKAKAKNNKNIQYERNRTE